jgi:hypothetical protein
MLSPWGTCRVRPPGTTGDDSFPCVDFGDNGQIGLINPKDQRQSVFAFDKVFEGPTTQEMVYLETQPLIRSVVDGYNVCIFAYGQTGSGKTHTMSGTDIVHSSGRGINYRALDDLFDLQHQRSNEVIYDIKVQMLEVYNEKVRSRGQPSSTRSSFSAVRDADPGRLELSAWNCSDLLVALKAIWRSACQNYGPVSCHLVDCSFFRHLWNPALCPI